MDVATVVLLSEREGWDLMASLPRYDPAAEMGLQTRLRQAGYAPDLVAAALAQSRLRARARDKFGRFADAMLFTPDGLEQATRLEVAARHADRYRRAGIDRVLDLGCGIGADAMAVAGLDLGVTAVDADAVTAAVAAVNLRHWPAATALHRRAEEVPLPSGGDLAHTGVWLDPARRLSGAADAQGRSRRVFSLDRMSPTWAQVQGYAAQVPATGAKLAPAFPHAAVPAGAEAQWVSWQGEVVECAVWWGPLADRPGRTALVLRRDAAPWSVAESDADGARPPGTEPVGSSLYEPDRAVIRAGLTGALARLVDGAELDEGVGYVTSERAVEVGWAHRYVVLDVLPWNAKTVRAWLRERGIGRLTIKKRGVALDPERVRRELKPAGDGEVTLVLTRVRGRTTVIAARPAGPAGTQPVASARGTIPPPPPPRHSPLG